MRNEKVHKEGQTKKYQGEKKEEREGKRSLLAVLTRNTDEVPEWLRDASQVVSLWMSNYLDTTTGNMRQSVRGRDYKSSSFRTPKGTEVENNPHPYPVRGNSLTHWWQIGCQFQKRLKTEVCAQLELSLESTKSCIRPFACSIIGYWDQSHRSPQQSLTGKRGFALKWAESNIRETLSCDIFFKLISDIVYFKTTSVGGQCGSVLPCSCSIRVIAILDPWASNTTWPWDTEERKCFLLLQIMNCFLEGIAWHFDKYTYRQIHKSWIAAADSSKKGKHYLLLSQGPNQIYCSNGTTA